jgi:hypothetical protein
MAEQLGQLVGKLLDFRPQPPTGPQRVEDVNVTVRRCLTADAGTEDLEFGDPVLVTDGSQAGLVGPPRLG